jgi:hypothetical protein
MIFEWLVGIILFISSFTLGFAGFGFALISVPLLSLLMPVQNAVALQIPFSIILFSYSAWYYRHHFSWKYIRPLILGTLVGLSLGAYVLLNLPEDLLKKVLATFISFAVIFKVVPMSSFITKKIFHGQRGGVFWGLLSGSFFGAYTIGGPPAALYILASNPDPLQAKSSLAFYFSGLFCLAAIIYSGAGILTLEYLKFWVVFFPVVISGFLFGSWTFSWTSSIIYHRVIDALLLISAFFLWIK